GQLQRKIHLHLKEKFSESSLIFIEVACKLRKAEFVFDRQAKGSHEIWHNSKTRRRRPVPNHPGVTQAGFAVDDFLKL
ncbi:MAG: type II toxin-antitoxin system HicA family toxin, partial [Candidatus Poribacteria bacterium]